MKAMIYVSEKFDFYGHKEVKFDFKRGTKIMSNGRPIICVSVHDLGREALTLLNIEFSELKKYKNMSYQEKAVRLSDFASRYSGEEGNNEAKRFIAGHNERFSEAIENLLVKIESF